MSDQEIISIETYCSYYNIEQGFIRSLEEYGLISIRYQESGAFIQKEDVPQLERFSRMYYELNINVEGIDALRNLLEKIKNLQNEKEALRAKLKIYE